MTIIPLNEKFKDWLWLRQERNLLNRHLCQAYRVGGIGALMAIGFLITYGITRDTFWGNMTYVGDGLMGVSCIIMIVGVIRS